MPSFVRVLLSKKCTLFSHTLYVVRSSLTL